MKVAVSSTGNDLASELDSRFGRCAWFVIVDTDTMQYEAVANDHAQLPSGAGIQAASFLASYNVEAVLTGNCGPKASQAFAASGINVYTGYYGTVKEAVESFKAQGDNVPPANQAMGQGNAGSQYQMPPGGSGGSGGRGMGMAGGGRGMGGRGRGMGMCGGRGMGMGMGMPMGGGQGMQSNGRTSSQGPATANPSDGASRQEALDSLKKQAGELKKALQDIEKKIDDLK